MTHRRIILYNDAPQFGGHEVMSARVANELATLNKVVYFHANKELSKHLRPSVQSVLLPFQSTAGPLAILRNINIKDIRWLENKFSKCQPEFVIVVQGSIDLSLRGTLAARRRKMKTVSYLPMAFPRKTMGLRYGSFFDRYTALFFRLFDAFITISTSQRDFIRSFAGPNTPVFVLDNCIPLSDIRQDPDTARIAPRDLRIGIVGRLEWQQKGLGHMIEVAESLYKTHPNYKWVIIGDGPDRGRLEHALKNRKIDGAFEFRGWMQERDDVYKSFDILFIPSLFEGVPMIMLEALAKSVPIFARLTPGTMIFTEYLPPFCLYSDVDDAVLKLSSPDIVIQEFCKHFGTIREKISGIHGAEHFADQIHEIMNRISKCP